MVEGAPLLREYGRNPIEGSNPSFSAKKNAPVAQLDRVSGYEPEGRRFNSFRAHQLSKTYESLFLVEKVGLANCSQFTAHIFSYQLKFPANLIDSIPSKKTFKKTHFISSKYDQGLISIKKLGPK